jgi:hypothetical protein
VRALVGCDPVFDTGLQGAKADFAWGGRYLAFHAPRERDPGYQILVVDLEARTVRALGAELAGSSYFPSWTRDGRLSFRYDGPDYRGFMLARRVLAAPAHPLPAPQHIPEHRTWRDVFPETPRPATEMTLVLVWGPWGAHSRDALRSLERARGYFDERELDITVLHAIDPGSSPGDAEWFLARDGIGVPRIPLTPEQRSLSEAHNQNPTTLLFQDGALIDRRMGAQSFDALVTWVEAVPR